MTYTTGTHERIAAIYADEMRSVEQRLAAIGERVAAMGDDPRATPVAVEALDVACQALREKAASLDAIGTLAAMWTDDQEAS